MAHAQTASTAVDTSEIFFEEGIIGVSRARRFQLLERDDSSVRMLRSLDIDEFALPVVDPHIVDADYQPRFSPRIVQALGIETGEPLLVLAIATLEADGPVANLRAPIVINVAKRVGAQIILDDRTLPLRAKVSRTEL